MNSRLTVVLVIASLCLLPLVAADSHTRSDFDTIDHAPEEKERASLSHADSKKALDGFSRAISGIQSSLERCETEVCQGVRSNADKRHELVRKAQQASSQEAVLLVERIAAIIDEDIASLERCETEVCKDVLSQERSLSGLVGDYLDVDSDGDGIDDGELLVDNGDVDGDGYGDVDGTAGERTSGLTPTKDATMGNRKGMRSSSSCPDGSVTGENGSCVQPMRGQALGSGDDCDDEGCEVRPGITDRPTAQRELTVGARRAHDQTTPLLYQGLAPRDLNESNRDGLGAYLRNRSELRGADFGLAVAYVASNNSRVRQVRFDNRSNQTLIEHEEDVRLFGFIPLRARARTVVSADGSSMTDYPWWAALGSKSSVGIEKITLAVESMYQE